MKKLVSLILLSAFMLLAFAGCGNTDNEKIDANNTTTTTAVTTVAKSNISATVELSKDIYSQSDKTIDFTITNDSVDEIRYGLDFSLDVKEAGNWIDLGKIVEETPSYEDILMILDKGESSDEHFDVSSRYGTLQSGEYRLVVTLYSKNDDLSTDYTDTTKIYAPFQVK